MRALALDAWTAQIFKVFHDKSLQPLLIKGLGTARWLYDSTHERPYGDIDLLVAPDEFGRSRRALAEMGFIQAELSSSHHDNFVRGSVAVELHRTLRMLSVPEEVAWHELSADAHAISLGGAEVWIPSDTVATLIVVLHAIQHGRRTFTPMHDLERALERVGLTTWNSAAELALRLDAGPIFAAGLRLLPQGANLARRLQLPDDPVPRLVHLRSMTPPDVAIGIEQFANAPGMRARLGQLARELVPSPAFMRIWKPLARRGRWGLACAYLWRPFWLMAKLPEGIRAWRAADRDAGSSA